VDEQSPGSRAPVENPVKMGPRAGAEADNPLAQRHGLKGSLLAKSYDYGQYMQTFFARKIHLIRIKRWEMISC